MKATELIDKKLSRVHIGLQAEEKHPMWKGDKVGYVSLHKWVSKHLGKPSKCEQCGFSSNNSRQFHWSNIPGEYKRELPDWQRLCVSCHFKFDNIAQKAWDTKRAKENHLVV